MNDEFEIKNHQYNFQRDVRLQRRNVNTVLYGTETIASLGVQIRNLVSKIWNVQNLLTNLSKIFENGVQGNALAPTSSPEQFLKNTLLASPFFAFFL